MNTRRTVRNFSDKFIPENIIETILLSASMAPSGAHKQPWTFCVVKNPDVKKQIRIAAEKEEKESYETRMKDEWLKDLQPIGTDWHKPFLETAPYLIVIFKRSYEVDSKNHKHQNYYVTESCGIACGFLLTAIHDAGLVALTHTPSPMNFLSKILHRTENEKPIFTNAGWLPCRRMLGSGFKKKRYFRNLRLDLENRKNRTYSLAEMYSSCMEFCAIKEELCLLWLHFTKCPLQACSFSNSTRLPLHLTS